MIDNLLLMMATNIFRAYSDDAPMKASEVIAKLKIANKPEAYGFRSGREALLLLFQTMGWKKIGIPAFTCPIIYQAAIAAGGKCSLIDVGDDFNLNPNKLSLKMGLDAVVVVHTFGNPANITKIRSRLHPKVKIVEDCAHGIGTTVNGRQAGELGDFALFSLYKQVPNLGGAILISDKPLPFKNEFEATKNYFPGSWTKTLFLSSQLRPLANFVRSRTKLPVGDETMPKKILPLPTSYAKLFMLTAETIKAEVKNRKQIATVYEKTINRDLFNFPQHLFPGSSAYNFSIIAKSSSRSHRNNIILALRKKNIFVDRLWYNTIAPAGSHAKWLAGRVINLPLLPPYDPREAKYLANELNSAAQNDHQY